MQHGLEAARCKTTRFAGITWNKPEVYKQLGGPPNKWDHKTTFHNIIQHLSSKGRDGGDWDPNSVRAKLLSITFSDVAQSEQDCKFCCHRRPALHKLCITAAALKLFVS
jgi:hypothetical protein